MGALLSSLIKIMIVTMLAVLVGCGRPTKLPLEGDLEGLASNGTGGASQLDFNTIFEKIIQPKCLACHANFTSRDKMISAGVVIAGSPEASPLYKRTANGDMPRGGIPLSDIEVKAIYNWINEGAIAKAPSAPTNPNLPGSPTTPGTPSTPGLPPSPGNPSTPPTGEVSPTFAWLQQNVFNARCVICHRGTNAPAGYDLSTYEGVTSVSRVIAGNPEGSKLFLRVDNNTMPPGGPALSQEVKDALATWIRNGAKDDAPAGGLPPSTPPSIPELPPLGPNYDSIRANIFMPRCIGCHNSSNRSGGVSLEDYNGVRQVVSAGSTKRSDLWDVLEDNEMPRNGSPLNFDEKEAIRQWINSGAREN